MSRRRVGFPKGLFIVIASLAIPSAAIAKGKAKPKNVPQDHIDILANLALKGGPVTRFTITQHYSRSYLYVEHDSQSLTLVDITDARHPSVIADLDLPPSETGSILTAAGDTALVSSEIAQRAPSKTLSIVSFSDPAHPKTVKQFANVTFTALDDHRGLIFVANDEGLWILHRNPAEDPEVQERYAHEVLYNH